MPDTRVPIRCAGVFLFYLEFQCVFLRIETERLPNRGAFFDLCVNAAQYTITGLPITTVL